MDISRQRTIETILCETKDVLTRFWFAATIADPNQGDCPIVWCNDKFCELTGYPSKEVIGRNCRFLQASIKVDTQPIKAAIANERDIDFRIGNVTKDGRRFESLVSMIFVSFQGTNLISASQGEVVPARHQDFLHCLEIVDRHCEGRVSSSVARIEQGRLVALKSWSLIMKQRLLQKSHRPLV